MKDVVLLKIESFFYIIILINIYIDIGSHNHYQISRQFWFLLLL